MKTLQEILDSLPEERRVTIEARAAELVAQEMTLRELRKTRRLTQESLAAWLRIGQDNVSRLEGRSDMRLSTLRSYLAALGGTLELIAHFPDQPPIILSGLGEEKESIRVAPAGRGEENDTGFQHIWKQARRRWSLVRSQIQAIAEAYQPQPTPSLAGVRRGVAGKTPSVPDEQARLIAIDPGLLTAPLLPLGCKAIPDHPNRYVMLFKVRQEPIPSEPPQVWLWIGETPIAVDVEYDQAQGRLNLIWTWEQPLVLEPIELREMEDGAWEVYVA